MNSQDMSIITLVLHASWVVQLVMLLLLGVFGICIPPAHGGLGLGKLAMAVMPANEWLSLEHLRQGCGAKSVSLANESEFRDRFPECEVGAMPPFGNLYGMEVYAADTLSHEHSIAFNAGNHNELVRMGWSDYERLVHPRVMSMTRH